MGNTTFGQEVRIRLIVKKWKLNDLAAEVSKRTGLVCDTSYLCRILNGQRNPPKIIKAIREILDLPEEGDDA